MNGTPNKSTCTHPDGCDRPLKSKDFCRPHWERLKRHGDLGPAIISKHLPVGRQCCVDDCERAVTRDSGKGMCGMHYQRWARHGDTSTVAKSGASQPGASNPNWGGDNVTYHGAHTRTRNMRGPSRYSCNPAFYEPRCVPCHSRHDRQERLGAGARP